ncbi:hypothetical protein DENSPDRAFT_527249 [Dentipellis sp. KUC8613]|nr:hypothetical protein DENSPDRAFT_527249 [Dentipellis sp. KUC8613]
MGKCYLILLLCRNDIGLSGEVAGLRGTRVVSSMEGATNDRYRLRQTDHRLGDAELCLIVLEDAYRMQRVGWKGTKRTLSASRSPVLLAWKALRLHLRTVKTRCTKRIFMFVRIGV